MSEPFSNSPLRSSGDPVRTSAEEPVESQVVDPSERQPTPILINGMVSPAMPADSEIAMAQLSHPPAIPVATVHPGVDDVILAWPAEMKLPRIWTVMLTVMATILLSIIASTIVYYLAIQIEYGPISPRELTNMRQKLESFAQTRIGFLAMVLPGQVIFFMMALLAAKLSPQPLRERLTLTRGPFAVWHWMVLALATPAVGFITSIILSQLTRDRGTNMETMQQVFRAHTGAFFYVMVAIVGILPGICEELFFRGYVQTRLLTRFPPLVAIGTTSLLFSIAHLDPLHAVAVFPLGVWLGIIAWQSRSIWPSVIGHTINNSAAVLLTQFAGNPKTTTPSVGAAIVVLLIFTITGTSLLLSLILLLARRTASSVSPQAETPTTSP